MPAPRQAHPIVVIKRPRGEWRIPRIDAAARLYAQQQEEARIKAFTVGTTFEAREIFRKVLYHAKKLVEGGTQTVTQVITEIEIELNTFPLLHREFSLILSRASGANEESLRKISTRGLAMIMVYQADLAEKNAMASTATGG